MENNQQKRKIKQTVNIMGTNKRYKGNVVDNFEPVRVDLLTNYLKTGIISSNDLTVYLYLLKKDNPDYHYAFPSIKVIALDTGLGEKTVKNSIKNLVNAGLVRKDKYPNHPNKNIYFIDLPLDEQALKKQVPELFSEYEKRKQDLQKEATADMERLNNHIKQKAVTKPKNQIAPKNTTELDNYKQLEEQAEREMLEKLNRMNVKVTKVCD